MRTVTQEFEVYTIETHPDKAKVFDWIRDNWHDLGDHSLEEAIYSAKALAEHVNATIDWSISIVPDRGEHITFSLRHDDRPQREAVSSDMLKGNCPLTGVCYDENLLDAFRNADESDSLEETLQTAAFDLIQSLHREGEYIYSDEGLEETCEANEYEFRADGSIYNG